MRDRSRRALLGDGVRLAGGAALGLAPFSSARAEQHDGWWQGDLVHLLPVVNHERLRIKASFARPLGTTPVLRVGDRAVPGARADSAGRFWQFDADGLAADTEYGLQLTDAGRSPLCDGWPLRTFPAPDADVGAMRILVYTCAGGDEERGRAEGLPEAVPKALRRRLFARGLALRPDAVIGVGDQVYVDRDTGVSDRVYGEGGRRHFDRLGWFDPTLPVLGTVNEGVLTAHVDPQIAQLYGVMFRSTPTWLTQDDHDYFENDEASEARITFPPSSFNLRLARATQHLYFPEFLPDPTRPAGLSGSAAADRAPGLSESFGTIRFGRLAEVLAYDCMRFLDLEAHLARFVPADAEAWLLDRTARSDARQLVHVPSTPLGWSAGKWAEWYPDVLRDGMLTDRVPKAHWQRGWFAQHQRLLGALAAQRGRPAVMVSGDLHAIGHGVIERSGDADLRANPVHSILSGPIGTEQEGFPSFYRGVGARVPTALAMDERIAPVEKLGFTVLDLTRDAIRVRQFAWWRPEDEAVIDGLEPFADFVIARS
jgi:hypothetical protein